MSNNTTLAVVPPETSPIESDDASTSSYDNSNASNVWTQLKRTTLNTTRDATSRPHLTVMVTSSDDDYLVLHVTVGVIAAVVALLIVLVLILLYLRYRSSVHCGSILHRPRTNSNSVTVSSKAISLHDPAWDDISLHYIDNPQTGKRDGSDDLASIDNDSYLNSLDELMTSSAGQGRGGAAAWRSSAQLGVPCRVQAGLGGGSRPHSMPSAPPTNRTSPV